MQVRRPSLIVLGIFLLAGLAYLFFGPDFQGPGSTGTGAGGATEPAAESLAGETAKGRPDEQQGEAGAGQKTAAGGARETIPGPPRYALTGRVTPRDAMPVGGAVVVAYRGSANDRRLNMMALFAAMDPDGATDPRRLARQLGAPIARAAVAGDGTFAFTALPARHVRLVLEHDFYGLAQPEIVHLDAARPGFVMLRPYLGGHLVGRIQGYAPAPEQTVRLIAEMDTMQLMQHPENFMGFLSGLNLTAPVTGERGDFEFRAVLPSSSIHVVYRGKMRTAILDGVAIQSGQQREIVLHTTPCGALAAKVSALGEPVAKVSVKLTPAEASGQNFAVFASLHGRTDAAGACRIESLSPGRYHAEVRRGGFVDRSREVVIEAGETTELVVDLDRGGSVSGRVVDADGAAVADAGLRLLPAMNVPIFGDLTAITGEDMMTKGARGSTQRSDAAGRFEIWGIENDDAFDLAAWHDDFAGGLARGLHRGQKDVVITMQRPASVRGTVVDDATGAPIPDFTVETLVRMMMVIERPSKSLAITGSADGAFELRHVPPAKSSSGKASSGKASGGAAGLPGFGSLIGGGGGAGKVTLRVQSAGFADLRTSIKIQEGQVADVGELRLQRGATVRGVVKSATGAPVAGCTVGRKAVGMLDNPMLQAMFGADAAMSDERGAFELTGLPPGAVILKASSPRTASGVTKRIKLRAGQVVEGVEIVLGVGGTIVGKLTLSAGMNPERWMITVGNQQGGSMQTAKAGETGAFRFDGIDPGRYDVQAMQLDWLAEAQSEKMGMFRPGQKIDFAKLIQSSQNHLVKTRCRVKDGETTEVELDGTDLGEDGVALTVRVTLGGRPMRAGWMEVERLADGNITMSVVQAGVAKLDSVPPGAYRFVVRTGMTMTPVGDPMRITVPAGKTYTVPLRLAGGSIEGRVVDEVTGEALPHAVVRVVSAKGSAADQIDEIGFALTNQDGAFRFEGLDDGKYSLFANDSFFSLSDEKHGGRLDDIRISGGSAVARVVLRARQAARATVHVSDAAGGAVGRTMILVVDPNGKPLSTLPTFTDGTGMATLNGLPPGEIRVVGMTSKRVPGYSDVQEIRTGGKTEFFVSLQRGPRVRVRIEDAAGKPIPGARVAARWRGGPWIPLALVARYEPKTGYLDLGHLPAGAVEFRVHSAGTVPFLVHRDLPAGASAEMVFTAPK